MARPTCPIEPMSAIWCQSAVGLSRLAFDPPDLAGDRPGVADGFDKMHPVADLQPVEIPLDQAVAVAERLRSSVEKASKEWLYPTSISIGIAYYPRHGNNANELLEAAEYALTVSKKSGKNRVTVAP